jgi:hypothetical protein
VRKAEYRLRADGDGVEHSVPAQHDGCHVHSGKQLWQTGCTEHIRNVFQASVDTAGCTQARLPGEHLQKIGLQLGGA